MAYDVFIESENRWQDYSWLRLGCTDEMHFNWFYSLFTATNPDIRQMLNEQTAYRKFESNGYEGGLNRGDYNSHFKRFSLIDTGKPLILRIGEATYTV